MEESIKLINKKELCELMGISIGKVDGLIKDNKIRYLKIGKNVRFRDIDIKSYLNRNYKEERVF
jgi:excisionase family DNA binding protein